MGAHLWVIECLGYLPFLVVEWIYESMYSLYMFRHCQGLFEAMHRDWTWVVTSRSQPQPKPSNLSACNQISEARDDKKTAKDETEVCIRSISILWDGPRFIPSTPILIMSLESGPYFLDQTLKILTDWWQFFCSWLMLSIPVFTSICNGYGIAQVLMVHKKVRHLQRILTFYPKRVPNVTKHWI